MQTPAQTAHQVSLRQFFKLPVQLIIHTSCATGPYVLRAVEYVTNRREVLISKIMGQYRLTSVYPTSIRTQSITENCALLGSYAVCVVAIPYQRSEQPIGSIFKGFLTLEDGTDRLSRNVVKELPLQAA